MIKDNSIFASQVPNLNSSNKISEDVFKKIVFEKLKVVLQRAFPDNYEKQKIKVATDRFQFACPFCHDSASDNKKKRGNFIFKQGPFYNCYKCFNCNKFFSIQKFFKEFNMTLPLDAIDYLAEHKSAQQEVVNKSASAFRDSMFCSEEMTRLGISREKMMVDFGLVEVQSNLRAYTYLTNRCITKMDNFLYDPKSDGLVILNRVNGKIVSFQMRSLREHHKGPKYVTVSLKMIHEKILKDDVVIDSELEMFSMIFNLYNIDPSRPILVTEGPIDSMFLPNCIATLGAAKKVDISIPLWYVYDSDKKGNKEAIAKLRKGAQVFMWEKLKKQYRMPSREKWDVNDFVIWCIKNGKKIPTFWKEYFTNDILDIMEV